MEGITIIETETLNRMIDRLEDLTGLVHKLTSQNSKPYLTTKEVCEILSKSENWVLLHKEQIGFSKRTGTLLFKRKDIDDFIEEGYFNINRRKKHGRTNSN